ncbi:MAG: twin-arginine translocation signal domain-containing protein [Phycisphaerae bacterium]|nr:twin-arginine translocation signal domain-containing protein [Phycisphaerae bacterium]
MSDRDRGGSDMVAPNRRGFLKRVAAGAVAAVGSQAAGPAARAEEAKGVGGAAPSGKLPTITIGKHTLTRLVAGSNPVAGYSHSTQNLAQHMREFFTLEETIKFAKRCEAAGINTWQTSCSEKIHTALRTIHEQGSKLQWICLTSAQPIEPPLKEVVALKPIAVVHHGGVTDTLFRLGKQELVHDFIKKAHDAGVMAGVSAHNPDNIKAIADKGWENDLFMTCFYYVTRPAKEIRDKLGTVPLGEPFLESDRVDMSKVVKQVKKPCLAFKILAAGRLAWTKYAVEGAFRFAFENIKQTDGVIVGMYPRFSDEISHNVELAIKHGMLA